MRKKETINLVQYLVFHQHRLSEAVKDCHIRFTRRDLDSLDLLEEIIAKERLAECELITEDILNILRLNDNSFEFRSVCSGCAYSSRCIAAESEKLRDDITNLVIDCCCFKAL